MTIALASILIHPFYVILLSTIISGWLSPILDRIAHDQRTAVCPVIDVIDDENYKFQYGSSRHISVGGFDWNLQFNWRGIPDRDMKFRSSDVDPLR
jgi:polypeptide N-acetylgalactosaminyltransferase